MGFVCWCGWSVQTEKQFDAHLLMHVNHCDYDIPDLINGTDRHHPWTFSSTKILVVARDMGICRCCGIKTDNYEVHHIKPRCEGGSAHPANLVLLCEDCHQITISALDSYGGVPRFCILPERKALPENQTTIASFVRQ